MTLVLLDTTLLIDAERGVGGIEEQLWDDDEPAIAAVTLAELGVGVDLATGRARARRKRFFDAVAAEVPVVAYDASVAAAHRTLLVAVRRAGRPRGAHDLIIAATAIASGRTLLTADRGFAELPGVPLRAVSDGGPDPGGARSRRG